MNKNIAVAVFLFFVSFIVLIGLFSYWHFETWRIVDWIIIVGNVIGGIVLIVRRR